MWVDQGRKSTNKRRENSLVRAVVRFKEWAPDQTPMRTVFPLPAQQKQI